jgi:hypothetical protein
MYDAKREDAIDRRRSELLSQAIQSNGKRRSLAILVGEVKDISPSRIGSRLVVKHAPRYPFMLADDVERRMRKAFANELALWDANEEAHLVAVATLGIGATGVASVEAIALMAVNENWVPVETAYEAMLIERLTKNGASFVKSMRYNMPTTRPMASLVLPREGGKSMAMYLVPDDVETAFREMLAELIHESGMPAWVWDIANGPMPDLPT